MNKVFQRVVATGLLSLTVPGATAQTSVPDQIDSVIESFEVLNENQPGMSLAVFEGDKITHIRNVGLANIEFGVRISDSSMFDIASMSKQFAALCILMLEDQGLLKVSDHIGKYFPELPPYKDTVTVWQLLHHTSGVPDYVQLSLLMGLYPYGYYDDEDVLDWLASLHTPNFSAGSNEMYSNSNYWLLEKIVERVSKMTMEKFAEEHIFKPLGMSHTQYCKHPQKVVKNRVAGYTLDSSGKYTTAVEVVPVLGGGGVLTCMSDMEIWLNECIHQQFFGAGLWQRMTSPDTLNVGEPTGTGCGLFLNEDGSFEHSGYVDGFKSNMKVYPDKELGFIVFCNQNELSVFGLTEAVTSLFFAGKESEEVSNDTVAASEKRPVLKRRELIKYTGSYQLSEGYILTINLEKDTLKVLQEWNQSRYPIHPKSKGMFDISPDLPIYFTFSDFDGDKTNTLSVFQSGETSECRRIEWKKNHVSLDLYSGAYKCDELGLEYKLVVEDSQLICVVNTHLQFELDYIDLQMFGYLGTFKFMFDTEDDKVTGFRLNAGRVNNLRFRKI